RQDPGRTGARVVDSGHRSAWRRGGGLNVMGVASIRRAAVLGAGSGGTTFAKIMADAGREVTIWARREEIATAIRETRRNPDYLPDMVLPPSVRATSDALAALDGAELVVLAVPSQTLRANLSGWTASGAIGPDVTLVSLMK